MPGALVSGRQSKWRRGVSIPDRLGFRGMDTNASAAMRIDLAKQHGAGLERELETVSALAQCPGCGGVGTYTEERAPRRRSSS